jgi:hypothetical protein
MNIGHIHIKYQCCNINVITWLHMQLIDSCYMVCQKSSKKPPTKTPKNPLKIPHAKIQQKSFVKTLT